MVSQSTRPWPTTCWSAWLRSELGDRIDGFGEEQLQAEGVAAQLDHAVDRSFEPRQQRCGGSVRRVSRREVSGVDAVEVDEQPFVAAGIVEVREVREGTEAGPRGRVRLYVAKVSGRFTCRAWALSSRSNEGNRRHCGIKPLEACPLDASEAAMIERRRAPTTPRISPRNAFQRARSET